MMRFQELKEFYIKNKKDLNPQGLSLGLYEDSERITRAVFKSDVNRERCVVDNGKLERVSESVFYSPNNQEGRALYECDCCGTGYFQPLE